MLYETGLTPRLLDPHEYPSLPDYGIGLTDMAKHVSGSDSSLPTEADDPVGLFDRMITEIPEAAAPLLPKRWSKLATVTASFGHGFAVQPLQGALFPLFSGTCLLRASPAAAQRAQNAYSSDKAV